MAVRLAVNINVNGADFWSEGAIPVAFHWVLALFVLVSARAAEDQWPACGCQPTSSMKTMKPTT